MLKNQRKIYMFKGLGLMFVLFLSFMTMVGTGGGSGSGGSSGGATDDGSSSSLPNNVVVKEATGTPADEARAISDNQLESMTISDDGTTLIFSAANFDNDIQVGDILNGGITDKTPHGLLRRVIDINEYEDVVEVVTEPATIQDLFQSDLDVNISQEMTQANTRSIVGVHRGVTVRAVDDPIFEYRVEIDNTIEFDSGHITAGGSIDFKLGYEMDLSYDEIDFIAKFAEDSRLEVSGELSDGVEKSVTIATFTGTTFFVPISGLFGLVVTPTIDVILKADGSLSAQASAWITHEYERWYKVSYANNMLSYSEPSPAEYEDYEPKNDFRAGADISTELQARAQVGPQLNILLYGVEIVYVNGFGYLSLDAGSSLSVDDIEGVDGCAAMFALDAGVTANAGVKLEIFNETFFDPDPIEIFNYSYYDAYDVYLFGGCLVNYGGGDGEGRISGQVRDAVAGNPLEGVSVDVIGYGSSEDAFTDESGAYSVAVPVGTYDLQFQKANYMTTAYSGVGVAADSTTNLDQVLQLDESYTGTGDIAGRIIDATTSNTGVADLTVELRSGMNNTTGTVIESTTTNADGEYNFAGLTAGVYTATASGSGYTDTSFTVVAAGGETMDGQNTSISPILGEGEVRIRLSWGDTVPDLDSHLTGPATGGGSFHCYFSSMSPDEYIALDRDDTTYEGPETITIDQTLDGTYKYMVHDYSNRSSSSSNALANSNAIVEVFNDQGLFATYNVPTGQGGTVWTIFEMDGSTGEITSINDMSYESDPSGVRSLVGNNMRESDVNLDLFRDLPEKDY